MQTAPQLLGIASQLSDPAFDIADPAVEFFLNPETQVRSVLGLSADSLDLLKEPHQ